MKVFELCAKLVGIKDPFSIGFSSEEDEDSENYHYFVIERNEFYKKAPPPNLGCVYWEIDDQCWGEYGGIQEVTLSRDRLIVSFDPSRPNSNTDYDEAIIYFSVSDSEFQELQKTLQKIMRGYEDKLNLID